ncbi:transcriptional regulator [Gemmata sp. G18]|uniref:Transcriptional regulator n=1 Tax=Gemmata palustris TaxID=2822762 RepID=A0ABS5C1Q1_9BACT|nr:transcriptional regulator [Gemmata palustris]MBP3959901.1 transcriptional regulator [Gemmata palustris]
MTDRENRPEPEIEGAGRFAYDGLDPVLHSKARIGILTALATHPDGLSFADLSRLCSLTDGNLSRHLDTLAKTEDSKPALVKITKTFQNRRPLTTVVLTGNGRKRFREYLAHLEQVLRDAAEEAGAADATKSETRPGLAGA